MSGSITTNKEIGCPVYSIVCIFRYDLEIGKKLFTLVFCFTFSREGCQCREYSLFC